MLATNRRASIVLFAVKWFRRLARPSCQGRRFSAQVRMRDHTKGDGINLLDVRVATRILEDTCFEVRRDRDRRSRQPKIKRLLRCYFSCTQVYKREEIGVRRDGQGRGAVARVHDCKAGVVNCAAADCRNQRTSAAPPFGITVRIAPGAWKAKNAIRISPKMIRINPRPR